MQIEKYLAKPNKTIGQHNEDLLHCLQQMIEFGYIKDEHLIQLLKDACKYHDYGKVVEPFQSRVKNVGKKIKFDPQKEIPHNVLSMYFLNSKWWDAKDDYITILFVVGFHHNYCDVIETLENSQDLIQSLLKSFQIYDIRVKPISKQIRRIRSTNQGILVKGLLHKCDYCGSEGAKVEYPNDFLPQALEHLMEKWKKRNKDTKWNALQLFCQVHKDENIMAIASTGMGKTEGALHWLNNGKGFFVLPLRTAINAMYRRIRYDILEDKKVKERIALLHSESCEYLLNNTKTDPSEVVVYNKMARKLSLPLTITTMDQLFDFVFRYAGYELKLATFSYSKLIIDEIQMYDAELLAYLIYGLEQINKIGGQIAIITATLAPFIEEKLRKQITFTKQIFLNEQKRHHIKVLDEKLCVDDISSMYVNNKKENAPNKILVICNTIKKAQEMYTKLEAVVADDLHMLHSRYTRMDREKLEDEIKKFADPNKGIEEIENGIWIATSIVEASLDLDFDYLFTELLDLNSFFQRLGRCNRRALKPIENINCFVYLEIDEGLLQCGFVDETIYHFSRTKLLEFRDEFGDALINEQQKIQMLSCFTTENLRESSYMEKYSETYQYLEFLRNDVSNEKKALRHIFTVEFIPYCVFDKYGEDILEIQEMLRRKDLKQEVRIETESKIRKYTVSVPQYIFGSYLRKLKYGTATSYGVINVSSYEKIPIVECIYTKKGFESIENSGINDLFM